MTHLGDITKIDGYAIEPPDVVTGGSPCQDLSVAGKRAGLGGARSGLFMEQIRMIREMREADAKRRSAGHNGAGGDIRPRYMVWENVPGAFISNKGEDFRAVLEETARIAAPDAAVPGPPKGKWTNAGVIMGDGWSIAWRVLDAQFWGVPQRRRRIALVADFGGLSAPEILFIKGGMSGDYTPSGEAGERAAGAAGGGADTAIAIAVHQNGDGEIRIGESCNTLSTNGNASGRNAPLLFESHQQENRYTGPLDASPTACRRWGTVGNNTPLVMSQGQANAEILADMSPTLNCNHEQPIVAGIDCRNGTEAQELCGTLQAHPSGGTSLNTTHPVRIDATVRRLTPLECELLQGYPSGWTDIPDYIHNGKTRKASDTARYAAIGNSIALPPWKWILKRISAQYERDATLGSLFDGIGGFPYLWEQLNGKGSAIWASEIEPFCIAVTKYRIG